MVIVALKEAETDQLRILLVRLLGSLSKAAKPHSRCFAHFYQLLDTVIQQNLDIATDLQLPFRLLCNLFDLPPPALPPVPSYIYSDVYLGYLPDSSPAASDRLPASEPGPQYAYLYSILARCHKTAE
jgi:hypothetical protein